MSEMVTNLVFVLKAMLLGLKNVVVDYWEIKCCESHGKEN